jgi:SAM-dependent methyltransferase
MASPLEWSAEMDSLFWNCVGKVVLDDPRTDWSENLSVGYPFDAIREQVLAKGLADFSQGHDDPQYGHLTPDEKALLYCFVNFKKHFFAAFATFRECRTTIEDLFVPEEKPLVLDIGCGPATACLALTDLLPGRNLDYIGVDSAAAMRAKAASLCDAARVKGLLGANSTVNFQASWTDLAVAEISPARSVLVVLSYCCASHTLTLPALQSLAQTVARLVEGRTGKPLVLAYMNSTNPLASVKYDNFKQALGLNSTSTPPTLTAIEYRKKRGGSVLGREEFVRQVLQIPRRN